MGFWFLSLVQIHILLCLIGRRAHSLTDIQKHSGLEDYRFWDAFYELLTDGELVAKDSRKYVVRDDNKQQWVDYHQ